MQSTRENKKKKLKKKKILKLKRLKWFAKSLICWWNEEEDGNKNTQSFILFIFNSTNYWGKWTKLHAWVRLLTMNGCYLISKARALFM